MLRLSHVGYNRCEIQFSGPATSSTARRKASSSLRDGLEYIPPVVVRYCAAMALQAVEAVVEGLIARLEADEQQEQGHGRSTTAELNVGNEAHHHSLLEGPAAAGGSPANTKRNDEPVENIANETSTLGTVIVDNQVVEPQIDEHEVSRRPAKDNKLKENAEEARDEAEHAQPASTPSTQEAQSERKEWAQQLEQDDKQRHRLCQEDSVRREEEDGRARPASRSMSEEAAAVLAKIAQRGRNRFGVGATNAREGEGDRGAAPVLSSTDSLLEKYAQMQTAADQQKRVGAISRYA